MALDEDLKKVMANFRKTRGVIKASLTRIRTFVENFDPNEQAPSLLDFRQEELPRISKRFEDVQGQIELLTEEPEREEEERDFFENEYFSIRSKIQEILNSARSASATAHNASFATASLNGRSRLAPIALPSFDGDIKCWAAFFDVFRVMVHEDEGYSPAQKFMYLRSCLKGSALEIVQSVPMTDVNYNVAIDRLKQRYDNHSLVIQAHIRALMKCPSIEAPSAQALQTLHAHVCTHVAALRALKQPVEHWDAWLVTIITSRIDSTTAHDWQLRQVNSELPSYQDLEQFLSSRCTAFENSEACSRLVVSSSSSLDVQGKRSINKRSLVVAGGALSCQCCAGNHTLGKCEKFRKKLVSERLTFVRDAHLCFNCLSPSHTIGMCKSNYTCFVCNRKHHTMLHYEKQGSHNKINPIAGSSNENLNASSSEAIAPKSISLFADIKSRHVFLSTAVVFIVDKYGLKRKCRAVLDCGSQVNFISKNLLKTLQLSSRKSEVPVSGIGCSQINSGAVADIQVLSRVKDYNIRLSCQVLPALVNGLPPCPISMKNFKIPEEVLKNLADPKFFDAGAIDLLIGGGVFYDIVQSERVGTGINNVKLQDSRFGWLVTGETGATCLLGIGSIGEVLETEWKALCSEDDSRFGRGSKNNKKCQEEEQARRHFSETARRDDDGRFVLRLPMKGDLDSIGSTYHLAKSRFLNIERKLQRDEPLYIEYVKFMDEYLKMGHMEEILNETEVPARVYYLPHHSVVKSSSLTTKVRVVFDASARGVNGHSLNDVLLCGPTVQDDVFTILCRFRKHQYVIMADVEKMYRQIKVDPDDCDLQRIFWRTSPTGELRTYRLLRITYGTAPASFMATQCLVALSEEYKQRYPLASRSIREDFYMDDLMSGHETVEGCLQLQQQISSILQSAQLPLRKWCSNSRYVREQIGQCSDDPLFALDIDNDDTVKSLGLCWKPVADEFRFNVLQCQRQKPLTKRMLLSDLNRVFDPLGYLTPVLIKGKIFLQQLWQIKADWDSILSQDLQEKWTSFYEELEELKHLSIPRGVAISAHKTIEIHGFCDASQEAYGACVYVRSVRQDNTWQAHLLCAKSRVAPLKGTTIPRLELNGALCLAQLVNKVAESWHIDCRSCRLWTDSTIVLGWLNAHSTTLKAYVANRISQILEVTDVQQWNYVCSTDNPADIISRGINARDVKASELWWKGPAWLSINESAWSRCSPQKVEEDNLPERRIIQLALVEIENTPSLIHHYSEWNRLKRAVAWLLRFVEYIRAKDSVSKIRYLSVTEMKKAEICILKKVQSEVFEEEVHALTNHKELLGRSKLKCLSPYMKNGLILVGGRLQNANVLEAQRHPIVLPASHKVTQLIFRHEHLEQLHIGPQALLAGVRRRYWPLRGRVMARSIVLKCVTCTRAKPRFTEPIMAALPKQRVQCARPFTVTGVDFAGPLIIRSGVRRVVGVKAWIAVFVCFSTRAVHLEAVEDLTSNSFIASLRRFIARRGRCHTIFSDNGTNFVGAQRELASYILKAGELMGQEGIEWRFNPPATPHFGGIWESAVKSAKHHLTRIMGETKLTIGELNTLLCQIEACLNSRPLTPLSSDPSDFEALTPSHFLIGGPMSLPPEPNLSGDNPRYLRRWKYVQLLMQTFWQRWQAEYLPQLQVRGKWVSKTIPLQINNIVIIKDECMPPAKWKLGRVTRLHPGADGVVRVASVKIASGTEMKRPTVKLCVLPTEEDDLAVENLNFQRGEKM